MALVQVFPHAKTDAMSCNLQEELKNTRFKIERRYVIFGLFPIIILPSYYSYIGLRKGTPVIDAGQVSKRLPASCHLQPCQGDMRVLPALGPGVVRMPTMLAYYLPYQFISFFLITLFLIRFSRESFLKLSTSFCEASKISIYI